jgi:gluconate 2-dehydrogenase alpha chain
MATKLRDVDVVLVGLGLTGGILAKELAESGLKVVGLERGIKRDTNPDFAVPQIRDELRYFQRTELMMDTARETITFRHSPKQSALPMRRLGAFLPGEGVGGTAVHWGGVTWRWLPNRDLRLRSFYEQHFGKAFVPPDMPIQDWGITHEELEPYYDKFEYAFAISGKAGNIKGQIQPGGNPFEGPRQREYPLPPLHDSLSTQLFRDAAANLGYHPFPQPAANASQPYTTPDGAKYGQCQYCGHCQRFGCEANAKGGAQISVIPFALRNPNFELRTHAWVTKVNLDSTRKKAVGVTYTDVATGEEYDQPAGIVIVCAYAINNVHLLLLSGIGTPYDPTTGKGTVGKNYCYQVGGGGVTLFFEDKYFNPFMGAGAQGTRIDDFHANEAFDNGKYGFIGGATIGSSAGDGRPIGFHPVPPGTPRWGSAWKRAAAKWYQHVMNIGGTAGNMPNRYHYYDLDPIYRNAFGQPLMRLTWNFAENDFKAREFAGQRSSEIAKSMNATIVTSPNERRDDFSLIPYQSTHNTGGAIMGTDRSTSVVNKYLQSWDVPNVFVVGASAFPHNSAYNPTGPLGALTYWTADAIKNRYVKRPGHLI